MEIQEFEKQNRRILQTKGELSQERKDKLESLQVSYDKLLVATQTFAELLDEDMPVLKSLEAPVDEEVIKYIVSILLMFNTCFHCFRA